MVRAVEFSKESIFVGRELSNGCLELYTFGDVQRTFIRVPGRLSTDPVRYSSYDEAYRVANELNSNEGNDDLNAVILGRGYVPTPRWQVYRMTIEKASDHPYVRRDLMVTLPKTTI